MSSIFIDSDTRVEVWDDEKENVMYVRQRMDFQTNALVRNELLRLRLNPDMQEGGEISATVSIELQQLAMLIHNVIGWDGPRFIHPTTKKPMKCEPKAIRMLSPTDPLVAKVLDTINNNNQPRTQPPPSAPEPSADPNSPAS